ncbi:uncharacterized protein LOC120267283 [Dioscorea cayenensis subsp. rotundata]|uniref:Uncharacterized protein LOC120267283 n=1 Tax=Dioscorea cayennensis subsp. rotundata TaxID=55577 RepID=A0AB40BWX1_DIOCR|nr:uncharacterized protein LOC120267283 [Dioscorea cayenensis subsp. rotundata]
MLLERPQGSLLRSTEVNPREHVKAFTLRSGQEVEIRSEKSQGSEKVRSIEVEEEGGKKEVVKKTVVKEYQPRIPYPFWLKQRETDDQVKWFLELFKQLHINLLFVDALTQMPTYAKFLKNLLTNTKNLGEVLMATLSEESSSIPQNKLPRKLKDPGSFTIPYVIGDSIEECALANLGANINVIPTKSS